jgi:Cellulose-binding Sde182, nucleoside hydrolase-like domain/Cellulose-binding protein Sde0182, C-terminal domain
LSRSWPILAALPLAFACLSVPSYGAASADGAKGGERDAKLRVIVETDIGGDADDQASFVRFLLYANEWDVEGIIADRPADAFDRDPVRDHLGLPAKNGLELAQAYVKAYGQVYKNLSKHKPDYPPPGRLMQRTVAGTNATDAGVDLIIAAADRPDPRPIWYGNWGSNSGAVSNLRRAFDRVQAQRSRADYEAFVKRFRICTLDGPGASRQGHDDAIALHIEVGYPAWDGGRWYHRFRPLTEHAGGFDVDRDVKRNHGQLGAIYTTPKEGDSWSFVYLIPTGLSDPAQPTWGCWAGRYGPRDEPVSGVKRDSHRWGDAFYWANQRDTWHGKTNRDNTAARWAVHLQNDFRARLDWCVAERFEDANHEPVPHCQGDASRRVLQVEAQVGNSLPLSAGGSTDPDGNALTYRWFDYPEPGTYRGDATLEQPDSPHATLHVPADATGKTIHVILEVTDHGKPPLTRYRRVMVTGK